MKKSGILSAILLLCTVFMCGCETAVGATKGLAYGVGAAAEGAVHDTRNTYNFIQATDQWIKANLW